MRNLRSQLLGLLSSVFTATAVLSLVTLPAVEAQQVSVSGGQSLATTSTPQFAALEINHATANTVTCSGGQCTIEGVQISTASNTQTLTGKSIASSQLTGTATNDSASAGVLGEYISSTVASGSAVSLTSPTAATITSITLTAGDWDVSGMCAFTPGATTSITQVVCNYSLTTNTLELSNNERFSILSYGAMVPVNAIAFPGPRARFSVSGSTTVYLVGRGIFTVSTLAAYGTITARRVR